MYVHYYFLKQVRLWLSLSVGRPNDILLDSGIAALGPTGTGANTNDAPGTPGDLLLGCTYKVGTSYNGKKILMGNNAFSSFGILGRGFGLHTLSFLL